MKAVLTLMLLALAGCSKQVEVSKTEFHFKQKVKITSGFFKGYTGTVLREGRSYSDCYRTYSVEIHDDSYGLVPGENEICNSKLEALDETK